MCPVLVGRDELLALTDRRWHSAQEGSGQLLLLAGEAGIGKTRLLGDLAGQIDGPGRVISAVAFPRDEAAYLQLALKLNPEPVGSEPQPISIVDLERDPVIG